MNNTAMNLQDDAPPARTSPYTIDVQNQIDFRTLRTPKNRAQSMAARALRKEREALGLCKACGNVPVANKKNCKPCTVRRQRATERSIFKRYGVELPWELR